MQFVVLHFVKIHECYFQRRIALAFKLYRMFLRVSHYVLAVKTSQVFSHLLFIGSAD